MLRLHTVYDEGARFADQVADFASNFEDVS
jgi:hypothetical protein